MNEQGFIERFKEADSREIKYLALDLITEKYDAKLICRLAKRTGIAQRLGYLVQVTIVAARKQSLDHSNLDLLVEGLLDNFAKWQFLTTTLPDYAKRIIARDSDREINKKWKVYSNLKPESLEDWINLYITRKYATTS